MAELDNLLGSRISLISQQDVRYEGILFSINQSESSIVLQNGNEIKDLYVHEPGQDNTATTMESENITLPDPPKGASNPPVPPPHIKRRNETHSQGQSGGRGENRVKRAGGRGRGNSAAAAGTGEHLLSMRERTGQNGQFSVPAPVKPEGEFDFESGLTSFKKAEVLAEVAEEQTKGGRSIDPCYNKDNFFDTLSCAALDGDGGRQARLTPSEERSLNQDTFGAIALQQSNYRRGGYRGGRGWGGGRGYHHGGGGGGSGNQRSQGGYNRGGWRRGGYSQQQSGRGGRGGQHSKRTVDQSSSS